MNKPLSTAEMLFFWFILIFACGLFSVTVFGMGYFYGQQHPKQTYIQKQNACIDWLHENASWRYTMCNLPMNGK